MYVMYSWRNGMTTKRNDNVHVAIIMDGNGRWAEARGMVRSEGHKSGAKRVKQVILHADTCGVRKLSLWGFSTDNWNRPEYEVNILMQLFKKFILQEADELHQRDACVTFIGDRSGLPEQLQRVMAALEDRTKDNNGLHLEIALNYGGRDEIVRAVNKAVEAGKQVTQESFLQLLDTPDEPDLIIRTSGEQRTSGFMPFQATSSEWYFEPVTWPEYTPSHFDTALAAYKARDRRFGGLSKKVV